MSKLEVVPRWQHEGQNRLYAVLGGGVGILLGSFLTHFSYWLNTPVCLP